MILSYFSQQPQTGYVSLLSLNRWGNWGLDTVSDLPKATPLIRRKLRLHVQGFLSAIMQPSRWNVPFAFCSISFPKTLCLGSSVEEIVWLHNGLQGRRPRGEALSLKSSHGGQNLKVSMTQSYQDPERQGCWAYLYGPCSGLHRPVCVELNFKAMCLTSVCHTLVWIHLDLSL